VTPDPFDDPRQPLFTLGQVATLLEVQQPFLRRLDALGVVQPARSGGGQRRYSRRDVERVRDAMGLIGDGLTVEGVRQVLALQEENARLRAELAQLRSESLQ
jgi:MerR family transcriptional regulator/heat shock protein HspR